MTRWLDHFFGTESTRPQRKTCPDFHRNGTQFQGVIPDAGYRMPVKRVREPGGHWSLVIGHWSTVTGHWLKDIAGCMMHDPGRA
jgi:hypothetical protein